MEKDYWVQKWKSKDTAFHSEDINPALISYFDKLKLQPGDSILVPLCGKSRDMLWIAEKGYNIVGIEISRIACEEFFAELNVTPTIKNKRPFVSFQYNNIELLCGDIFELLAEDLPSTGAVYDCKALIALPPAMRKRYVNQLIACVGTGINILLIAMESSSKVSGPPFSIDNSEVSTLYEPNFIVHQIKNEPIENIPEHLLKKGYINIKETVYLISGR